jgi:catechol 2,3-dioxygenase
MTSTSPALAGNPIIHPETTLGVVALSVADLSRSVSFYQQHIGLTLLDRSASVAYLGVPNRPLLQLHEQPGARLVRRATGLYHMALLLPSRLDLARVIAHFIQQGTQISGASDHLVSEALYLDDPDGHGIEIYRDRPRSEWYDAQGRFLLGTIPLKFDSIMRELPNQNEPWRMPDETIMGHVHLQVRDVPTSERFYVGVLGFERMANMGSATFLGAGGYHHHLGANTWASAGAQPAPADAARLLSYTMHLPDELALAQVLDRIRQAGATLEQQDGIWVTRDPSQNSIRLLA